ncbi:MAG TPA: sensor domain-containing diguanylate cyclase [Luteimonas sp.]
MSSPTVPANEAERLAALVEYAILDTPPDQAFQDLVDIAAAACDTPMAMVTLLDTERQWVKAAMGMPLDECRREDSLCTHAILVPDQTMVVEDAATDARFRENPFVLGGPRVRFYAGAPLVTPAGHALGAVCVMDVQPRTLSPRQLGALEGLARQAVAQIELRRAYRELRHHASERAWYESQLEAAQRSLMEENAQLVHATLTDPLTGLPNRRAATLDLQQVLETAGADGVPFAVAIVDIDFFKAINDRHGHPVGDDVLRQVAQALVGRAGPNVRVARLGGEEFVVVMPATTLDVARAACEAMRTAVAGAAMAHPVTVSIGITAGVAGDDVPDLYARADLALYRAKCGGRNRVVTMEAGATPPSSYSGLTD